MKSNRRTRRAARRLFRLSGPGGQVDEGRVRAIARRLTASERRGSGAVLRDYLRLVRIALERRSAVVESAVALADDIRADVTARLAGTYGAGLTTTFTVNPALLGGMRIKVGSDVYDGSVRARLAALQARL